MLRVQMYLAVVSQCLSCPIGSWGAGQQLGLGERSEESKRKRAERGAEKKAAAKARKRELFREREQCSEGE